MGKKIEEGKIKKGEASGRGMAIAGIILGGIGLLLAVIMIIIITDNKAEICTDIDCFIAKANKCEEAIFPETTEMGDIYYYSYKEEDSDKCTLEKSIHDLKEDEDPIIKKVLENKRMECTYTQGNFNTLWMTSMTEDLDDCQGELKDAIGPLILLLV